MLEDVKGFGLAGMLRRIGDAWTLRGMRTCALVIRGIRSACTSRLWNEARRILELGFRDSSRGRRGLGINGSGFLVVRLGRMSLGQTW